VPAELPRHSLRRHLLALFAMLLLAGATVLVVDEYAQYRARRSLQELQAHSLGRLRALKAVSDGYNLGVVDTTFKVRNDLIGWDEGIAALDAAQARTERNWQRLRAMPHVPMQHPLLEATTLARVRADVAAARLRAILRERDIVELGRFADTELYPAVDPVVAGLQRLSDQAMVQAEDVVRADVRRGWMTSALRIGLSALAFLVAVVAGRRVLANAHRYEDALRDSEARAHEANRAKSAFLATMSHEIRTPMIGVTGMVEVLSHTRLDDEQRRALDVIESSAQSLLRIIGRVLDLSKIEAGRLELVPEALSLERLVRDTTASFDAAAAGKGLSLLCKVDGRIAPAYYADGLRLRQVLSNFISNAIKFTQSGGVRVSLELLGSADGPEGTRDRLRFQVADTGIGIGTEAQARLFQPFEQAAGDTTQRYGGTGLGLSICRRLAVLMGGEVAMDSRPGIGTTLRLDVPLARAPFSEVAPTATAAREPAAFAPRDGDHRVLLVDDHPTNRLVIARQLALAGFDSESAADGEQGLAMWRSGRFALVLSDVHMPVLDGYAMARRIRAEEAAAALPRTPIVALAASALKGEAERCLAAGMDDYLAKPVSIAALAGALQRWLPQAAVAAPATGAAVPEPAHVPALDPTTLDTLTAGNAGEARLLLDDFLASTVQDLDAMEAARTAGALGDLAREAHKLKGAARMIGALELARVADRLEAAAREADWPGISLLAAEVGAAAGRLRLRVERDYPA
jgi:signal transduction histidine kinase/DNA-binding NarL/FixJ family response regulator